MVSGKIRVLRAIFSNLLIRIVCSNRTSFAFLICLLVLTIAYRIQLTIGLLTNPVKPFDFHPAKHPVEFMLTYFPYDFAVVLVCFLISWLLSRVLFFFKESKASQILKRSGFVFLHLFLILLILIHGLHLRLLFDVQTGLDYSVITEAFSAISPMEGIKLMEIGDYLFLLLPIGIFWSSLLIPMILRIWMAKISFPVIIILLSISVFATSYRDNHVPPEIRLNPTLFLVSDMVEIAFSKNIGKTHPITTIHGHESGIAPAKLQDVDSMKLLKFPPPFTDHQWNVIFFIMESVGTRYIFDTSYGNPMPMPFLHRMTKEGWFLKRHLTTSNVSTKALFSLFSGLYDFFGKQSIGTRPDANVPSVSDFLGKNYDCFLVTPSSISWYFPTAFFKNSGMSEVHSYENLNFKIKEELHSLGRYIARDEIQTVDFFINRIKKSKEPFIGIYISFAAHFPYFDYGEDYRIVNDDEHMISRYYNNLNLLDQMIKRIYDHLKEQGLSGRTIFVIVGDHGQAFGQHHPNNFMHYRYSYNENLETPAVFYQPALFKPKTFELPTSHVDLLPTLLDAMNIPYNSGLFDGESLFRKNLRREYLFFYGYEGSLSSLSTDLIKVQYSLKEKRCWAFDLKSDPEEKNPLDCSTFRHQLEDLHHFVSYHDSNLVQYSASLREKEGFEWQGNNP